MSRDLGYLKTARLLRVIRIVSAWRAGNLYSAISCVHLNCAEKIKTVKRIKVRSPDVLHEMRPSAVTESELKAEGNIWDLLVSRVLPCSTKERTGGEGQRIMRPMAAEHCVSHG